MKNICGDLHLRWAALGFLLAMTIPTAAYAAAPDSPLLPAWEFRIAQAAIPKPVDRISQPTAVAYLVNGFTGCCISPKVWDFLRGKGARVHESNWNEIDRKGNPGDINPFDASLLSWKVRPDPPNDETFIKQMLEAIGKIPPTTPLILIGHSFGGDAILQVATRLNKNTGRRIAFLGVLDAVGKGGLRKNVTSPVPPNVEYFFNRWQANQPFQGDHFIPFDRSLNGDIKTHARDNSQGKQNTEKTAKCDTKYRDPIKAIPQLLQHGEVPKDSCIQQKIIELLAARIFR